MIVMNYSKLYMAHRDRQKSGYVYYPDKFIRYQRHAFNYNEIKEALDFAFKCYKTERKSSHGEDRIRSEQEIFDNTFEGKLGEIAVKKQIKNLAWFNKYEVKIDNNIYPRGKWDSYDLELVNKNTNRNYFWQIKSSKPVSQFLLLESNDYDSSTGYYKHVQNSKEDGKYDRFIFERVEHERINLNDLLMNSGSVSFNENDYSYDTAYYLDYDQFLNSVLNVNKNERYPLLLRKGCKIEASPKTKKPVALEAPNYYVQCCDLTKLE